MLRNPQHLVLQLYVAPTRRTLTTAATSSYSADKAPPPPPSSPSSLAPSHAHAHAHTHTHAHIHVHTPARPLAGDVKKAAAAAETAPGAHAAVSAAAHAAHAAHTAHTAHHTAQASHSAHSAAAASAAEAAASSTVRIFRITSEPNVARRQVRSGVMASQARSQRRSRSEDRVDSAEAMADDAAGRSTSTASRLTSYFPLGYKEAVHQWWSSVSASAAERGVLSYVPYVREAKAGSQPNLGLTAHQQHHKVVDATATATATTTATTTADAATGTDDPYGSRLWRSQMVALSGKNRALNEYSIERVGETTTDTLVMLHGYGAGLGFYYRNFEPLSRLAGWRLYALDLLGMGNSSRPPFKVHAKDAQGKIAEAENWFVDSLEEWRRLRKIERFTLLGHSMGGYLAVSYALKYPGHVNKLILASPVGVPEDPYAVSAGMPEPEASTLASEFTQDQAAVAQDGVSTSTASAASAASPNHNYTFNHNHHGKKKKHKDTAATTATERRPLPGWLVWLWDANVSPFSLVRASGPLGPRLVSGWTSRRFSHLEPDEADALHTYTYSLFRQRGSGEYALPYLLAPGAYARSPIINRIQNVGRQVVRPAAPATATTAARAAERETGIPIVMLYGDHDWMDVAGGYAAEEKIKKRVEQALLHGTADEQRLENGSAKVLVVRNAGHHLYLDNPDEFNRYITSELADVQATEQRRRRQAEVEA